MEPGTSPSTTAGRAMPVILATVAVVAGAAATWMVRDILLLVFAAVLGAVLLDALGRGVGKVLPVGRKVATGIAILLVAAIVGGAGWVFGSRMAGEAGDLLARLPSAFEAFADRFGLDVSLEDVEDRVRDVVADRGASLVGRVRSILSWTGAIVLNLLIVLTGAVYFALQPGVYRAGLVRLLAPAGRERIEGLLDALAGALRHWMVGQILSMTFVGVATTAALLLLGVPSAVVLGVLAGLAEFVPMIGPIVAAVPAVLIASGESLSLAGWTALAYVAIQQLESNVALPLIQREMVSLPPATTVFSILAFGVVFGLPGVLLAAPLTVVAFVVVRRTWPAPADGEDGSGGDGAA